MLFFAVVRTRCGYRVVNVAVPTLHNGNGTGKKHTKCCVCRCATRALLHGRPSTGPLNGDAHHRKQKTFPLAEKGQKGEMGKERKQKKKRSHADDRNNSGEVSIFADCGALCLRTFAPLFVTLPLSLVRSKSIKLLFVVPCCLAAQHRTTVHEREKTNRL